MRGLEVVDETDGAGELAGVYSCTRTQANLGKGHMLGATQPMLALCPRGIRIRRVDSQRFRVGMLLGYSSTVSCASRDTLCFLVSGFVATQLKRNQLSVRFSWRKTQYLKTINFELRERGVSLY